MSEPARPVSRRGVLRWLVRGVAALGLGMLPVLARGRIQDRRSVWQIDPHKCIQCGRCADSCVLGESAVKCVHSYAVCGYCDLCMGYLEPGAKVRDTAAESQLCPVGAIRRTFVEDPYYEYSIDETLCVGCGRCVRGCTRFGNGSLYLQVRHNRCLNCNRCAIARVCPADAFVRVPAKAPYLLKRVEETDA